MSTGINLQYVHKVEATAGVCFLVIGLVAPILGGLFTAIEWMLGQGSHPWIHVVGTALFIAGIPLILVAGFCLDGAENARKRAMNKR